MFRRNKEQGEDSGDGLGLVGSLTAHSVLPAEYYGCCRRLSRLRQTQAIEMPSSILSLCMDWAGRDITPGRRMVYCGRGICSPKTLRERG